MGNKKIVLDNNLLHYSTNTESRNEDTLL